jgi:hypothetical protein
MIHTQHSWVAFAAAVITCLAFAARVHAQSPVPTPSPSATSANEQGSPLQQIRVTGYIIPHVGDGPQPVVSCDRDYSAGCG